LQFRHIAIEGPIGAGKTALAERLGTRLDATVVLEEADNPFLVDFYADRPGSALQAQLFYLLSRHRQQTALRQGSLQPDYDRGLSLRQGQNLRMPLPGDNER
jgi:deoxyadenosine/deoxycytidine kinase